MWRLERAKVTSSSERGRLTSFTWPSPNDIILRLLFCSPTLILVAKSDLTPASSPCRACDLPHLLPLAQMPPTYRWRRMTSIPHPALLAHSLSRPSSISIHPPFRLFMFLHSNAIHASGDPPYSQSVIEMEKFGRPWREKPRTLAGLV